MPSNLRIDPDRLWSALMETAAIGATAKGGINRQTLTVDDGAGARLVQARGRGAGLQGHGGRGRQHVRAAPRPAAGPGADRARQPPRHAADRRQVRRRPRRARRARSHAHAGGGRLRDQRAVPGGQLDQRGGRALRARPCWAPACSPASTAGPRPMPSPTSHGVTLRRRARRHRLARRRTRRAATKLRPIFELHIEQGPILEAEAKTIGVVTGVQGVRWYEAARARPREPCRHHADAEARRCAGRLRPHRRRGARASRSRTRRPRSARWGAWR